MTLWGQQEHWCISFMHLYQVKLTIMYSRLDASRVNRIRLLYLLSQIHSSRLFNAKNYCWTIYFVKKMPPLPRGRDGLARSFVHGSTHHCWREKGSKLLARGALGAFALGVGSFSPRAPETVHMERRMAWRIWCVPNQTTNPSYFWDCWSRGQKVSVLLGSDRLDRRLSWTPPISIHSVLYL